MAQGLCVPPQSLYVARGIQWLFSDSPTEAVTFVMVARRHIHSARQASRGMSARCSFTRVCQLR